jgi:peroxiredoxin
MANQLTGNFDAALQISVQRLNGLLATLHQNRWEKEQNPTSKLPTFPHTDKIRLGPVPHGMDAATQRMAAWIQKRQRELAADPTAKNAFGVAGILSSLPPGAAAGVMENFVNLQNLTFEAVDSSIAQGLAEVQISAPFVIFAAGETNAIPVHVFVRVRYLGDTPSHLLPQYIHGEVRIVYDVKRSGPSLKIVPPEDDSGISFHSETPLSFVVTKAITDEVAILVRKRFRPNDVDVTTDFGFSGAFKTIGSGSSQVLAVPLSLTGGVPSGTVGTLTQAWLGNQDFALAVGHEFVDKQFAPVLDPLRGQGIIFTVSVDGLDIQVVRFTLSILDAKLEWTSGVVTLKIVAKAAASAVFGIIHPSYDVVITQRMQFLQAPKTVTLVAPDGDFKVTGLPDDFGIRAEAERAARNVRNQFLPSILQMVPRVFQDGEDAIAGKGALRRIGVALRRFDWELAVKYTGLEVTTNGLIVRGSITKLSKPIAPIVDIRPADGGDSYTALHSWIPGGRVEKFVWRMYEKVPFKTAITSSGLLWTVPWEGLPRYSGNEEDHFMFPNAWTIPRSTAICLEIRGTRRNEKGVVENVSGFDSVRGPCMPPLRVPIFILPNWKKLWIPNLWPDFTGEVLFEDLVYVHINATAEDWPAGELTTNHLVHFLDWNAEQPLQAIHEALTLMKTKMFALTLVVVVPQGAMKIHRAEMEQKLGLDGPHEQVGRKEGQSPIHIEIAEDAEQGWSKTFNIGKAPATFFVNARRDPLWGMEGQVDPGELAAVLDKQMVPAPAAKATLPQSAVRPGQRMPPLYFTDDQGSFYRLEDFADREVLLCFWQSWSQPCIRELQRLDQEQKESEGLIVIAICGDDDPEVIARIRGQYQLSIIMAPDPDGHMADLLKVRCLPTTMHIGRGSLLYSTQFGYPMKQALGDK